MIKIIGNGPSLNTIDKSKLFNNLFPSVSYNRAYIIYETYNFYPTYYFCIDKAVLLNCLPDIKKLLNSPIQYFILLECNETLDLLKHEKITLIQKNNDNKYYFGDVATFSIYYLYQNGFQNFDIYGCDCNYIEDYQKLNVDLEFNTKDPARKIILKPKKGSKDPNHFLDNYFDESTEYSVPRTQNHLSCWKYLFKIKNLHLLFKTKTILQKIQSPFLLNLKKKNIFSIL